MVRLREKVREEEASAAKRKLEKASAARRKLEEASAARLEKASAAKRKLEEASAVRRKDALDSGPSVAKVLRQLDRRSQRIKAMQQEQHWGTGPLKEWESEQVPYKVETPDPYEKE